MTMEELVIAVRVSAEGAEQELGGVADGLRAIGQAGDAGMQRVQRQLQDTAAALSVLAASAKNQQEAYALAVSWIEHRAHIGESTAQEEIAGLEMVRRMYAQTAAQIMAIDQKIYDARQALRAGEESRLTALHSAAVSALGARYEEQRAMEQQKISESIAAWEKWSEDTCAAIQKQIDALDAQAQAEDRAAVEAEHLRRIGRLEQAIGFETDAYDQRQLLKQLEQAREAWAQVQRDWSVADQREALQAQLEAAGEQASAEIDALEKESERIDSVYDEMVKGQSLAAEAQKLLMESTQEELLSLLSSYAPDYEATGRSLGEKIYEGFQSAFGDITAWFDQVDAQFEEMAEKAQQSAFGTTGGIRQSGQDKAQVSGPTINQTVNFNQPVESAADVTRRMQQVSEELAGMV